MFLSELYLKQTIRTPLLRAVLDSTCLEMYSSCPSKIWMSHRVHRVVPRNTHTDAAGTQKPSQGKWKNLLGLTWHVLKCCLIFQTFTTNWTSTHNPAEEFPIAQFKTNIWKIWTFIYSWFVTYKKSLQTLLFKRFLCNMFQH